MLRISFLTMAMLVFPTSSVLATDFTCVPARGDIMNCSDAEADCLRQRVDAGLCKQAAKECRGVYKGKVYVGPVTKTHWCMNGAK